MPGAVYGVSRTIADDDRGEVHIDIGGDVERYAAEMVFILPARHVALPLRPMRQMLLVS